MRKYDLIITRHPSLVEYLKEEGVITGSEPVISHVASTEEIEGKHVIGVLPHSLSCKTASMTEAVLKLPPEKRGKELTLQDMRDYCIEVATYIVRKTEKEVK